ncbi:MAG: phosphoglucosamine mutase [Pseudomonadota bacterium]|nr:phosphoglucosamine mutase [Pseudomonadota bacterium]
MSKKFFGTDGIRGRVGDDLINPDFFLKLGSSVGNTLRTSDRRPLVVLGKDTRNSGYMLESALEAGFSAVGVDVALLGPIPTPAVAYMTRTMRGDMGVVISASHNPFDDNGVKFFDAEANKLGDEMEQLIERQLNTPLSSISASNLGHVFRVDDARGRYIEFCKGTVDSRIRFDGLKVVLDCANGATYAVAPPVYRELGADVTTISADPDGSNINENCGSMHPEHLCEKVLEMNADVGIALDGDGDRVIMVGSEGEIVDGDELLYVIALSMQLRSRFSGGVVGTEMSNGGLQQAFEDIGIPFERAKVGDRHVVELMRDKGWILGGESSGHIVGLDWSTTGDGIVSSLQVLVAMIMQNRSLSDLTSGMTKIPQEMINVTVKDPGTVVAHPDVIKSIRDVEGRLGKDGRVLVRPSGTEPLLRVMVEGKNATDARLYAERIVSVALAAVNTEIGISRSQ